MLNSLPSTALLVCLTLWLAACRAEAVPNVVELPACVSPAPAGDPFTFLFVATLRYYPNQDGIAYFCREILPLVRELSL